MKNLLQTAVVAAALAGAAPVLGAGGGAAAGPFLGSGLEDGTVAIGRSHDGPLFADGLLAPGHGAAGSIRVWNDGSSPARFSLTASVAGNAAVADAVRLRIVSDAGVLYAGSVSGFERAELGVLAPGAGVTVRFRASLPRSLADAALDGRSLSASFAWHAAQA